MNIKTSILRKISALSGYSIFKKKHAAVGFDLSTDLRYKLMLPMRTVFDVGANMGQTAMEIQREFPAARVFSFEPVKATFNKLVKNTANLPCVNCTHAALGEREEKLEIRLFPDDESVCNTLNINAMNTMPDAKVETIQVITGDAFCTKMGIEFIDLLKIDTEGFEGPVIKGFGEMLRNGKIGAIYCEVTFNPKDKAHTYINDLNDIVFAHDYHFFALYDISNGAIKVDRNYANILYISSESKARLVV